LNAGAPYNVPAGRASGGRSGPRVNFLLVAMVVLIRFMMNHHNFFTQPP
jgi:hypothetical protein